MKILDYAKTIRLEMLEYVAKIVTDYKENEWHNAPEGFCLHSYNDAIEATILASRTIPIHNGNGYQGDVYQFLWRANMDYHQLLTSEPQPMQQPTDYAAQLSAVKTLPELFDFRAKLKAELNSEVCAYLKVFAGATTESAQSAKITDIKFFIDRVESQIKSLENNGVFLAAVDGRGAVRDSNDLILEKAAQVETLVENSAGIIAEAGLSPIEKEAKDLGFLDALRMMQSSVNEEEWGCLGQDSLLRPLYVANLIARVDVFGKNIYLWRHDMDYIDFLVKNQPKN